MSPETLSNKKAKKPADVWATTISLCKLYSEKTAWDCKDLDFELKTSEAYLQLIKDKKTPDFDKIPADLHAFLTDCLKFKPEERCKMHSIIHAYALITKNETV